MSKLPSRRAVLTATAPIATSLALAPFVRPAAAAPVHPDAELLALREPYERTLAELEAICDWHTPFEDAYFAYREAHPLTSREDAVKITGLDKAEAIQGAAATANLDVIEQIAATPARTLDGLRFKAEVSRRERHDSHDLLVAIADSVLRLSDRCCDPPRR